MKCIVLKCGDGLRSSTMTDGADKECICFSEEGSCYCQSCSNFDSERDSLDSRSVSSVVGSDCIADIDDEIPEHVISLGTVERDCRICNLSLRDMESGIAIELGCSCKDDLGAAHQHCAETWFRIQRNNICEICHSIAQNVVLPNDIESMQQNVVDTVSSPESYFENIDLESRRQSFEVDTSTTNADAVRASSTSECWTSGCWELLVYIFVIFAVCGVVTLLHHFDQL